MLIRTHPSNKTHVIGDIWAFVCGILLPLAFAPFEVYTIALLAPAFLLILWANSSPSRAALRGWLFGLGFFGVGASWTYVSIHTYGQSSVTFAVVITAAFILFLASFLALQ